MDILHPNQHFIFLYLLARAGLTDKKSSNSYEWSTNPHGTSKYVYFTIISTWCISLSLSLPDRKEQCEPPLYSNHLRHFRFNTDNRATWTPMGQPSAPIVALRATFWRKSWSQVSTHLRQPTSTSSTSEKLPRSFKVSILNSLTVQKHWENLDWDYTKFTTKMNE